MKDKYVITKYEDFYSNWCDALPLRDCVVIRLQDRFASAGLYGYASAIQSVIEAAKDAGVPMPPNLEDVRNYFFEMAQAAENYPHKKWPD